MEDMPLIITLRCLFCDSKLEGDTEKDFHSGDQIECQKCGESNDYDSLVDVAKEEGAERIKKQVEKEISEKIKGIFK
jgi:hydrogenase maturation factor HypF (carbamoyltransferase family)